jgi:hypothetical protein
VAGMSQLGKKVAETGTRVIGESRKLVDNGWDDWGEEKPGNGYDNLNQEEVWDRPAKKEFPSGRSTPQRSGTPQRSNTPSTKPPEDFFDWSDSTEKSVPKKDSLDDLLGDDWIKGKASPVKSSKPSKLKTPIEEADDWANF